MRFFFINLRMYRLNFFSNIRTNLILLGKIKFRISIYTILELPKFQNFIRKNDKIVQQKNRIIPLLNYLKKSS